MEIFIILGACICSVSIAAVTTFIAWVVCKLRRSATKPNYAALFLGVLIGVFFAYLALVAITDGGHSIPK